MIPADADFAKLGTPSFLTGNDRFYRVDTALTVPQVRAETGACGCTGWSTARSGSATATSASGRRWNAR
ncbi:hypothetical protein [Amycolatopsis sp. CA-128772]|uniref:hypothetical protein n=1 Tax=Amycolatopsis sp. CA-128772 TaxID=2073159 RepID=UPI00351A02EA